MALEHSAGGQYHWFSGGQDHYEDELVERFQAIHGEDTYSIGVCESCGDTVHTGAKGYNEQVSSYIRYGPFFVCGECICVTFDLPEIPFAVTSWWEDTSWLPDDYERGPD